MKLKSFLSLALFTSAWASAAPGYYRYPDIHGQSVVFTAEGDLWVAGLKTPDARRLTTHLAEETYAAISPDGTQVAYVADYEGRKAVYVIPIDGGLPKRVSFENGSAMVQGWTSDGKILYSYNAHVGPPRNWTLKTVDPKTLVANQLPLADARDGAIDEKGGYVYFSRFGLANYNDNVRTYRGGAEGEIWRYELGSRVEAEKLTGKHVGNARSPMVYRNKIYFISDADGIDNLWQMMPDGSKMKQLTHFKDWPVRSARQEGGRIIFQLGADLKVLDIRSLKVKTLNIALRSDFPNLHERWLSDPLKYATSFEYSAHEDKVAMTARGRVALAGKNDIRLVEIDTPKDSRTRGAVLSPDGKWVYAINDQSGEQEIWRFAADGSDNAKRLTSDGNVFRWSLKVSPDGKYIAHDDKHGDLWLLSLDTLDNRKILSLNDGFYPYDDIVWSADSKTIALSTRVSKQQRRRIAVYSLDEQRYHLLTSDKFDSYSPTFSRDGNWLFFLSDRHFHATPGHPWGDRNMGGQLDRRSLIFAYGLKPEARFGFQARNELMEDSDKAEEKPLSTSAIDWTQVPKRLWQVDVPAGNYWHLSVNDDYLFVQDWVNEPGSSNLLKSIKIQPSPKVETFASSVSGYQLSDDGKQLFVRQRGNRLYAVDAAAKFPKDAKDDRLKTNGWTLLLDPAGEWRQMFHDAWLQHRDTLFDKHMRGVDWQAVDKKYRPLLARVTDRWELNDLLGQMVGPLNTMHSQTRTGDAPVPTNRPQQANLGAELGQTDEGVLVERIYRHDPEMPWRAAPLDRPGVDAKNGDVITHINGLRVKNYAELVSALRNQVDKQVLLQLHRGDKTVKTIVVPTSTSVDAQMRYKDWVNGNRIKVEKADDRLGYFHLAAMGSKDIDTFAEEFYANYRKQGLIIDVRRNRGGNIDSWVIEKLMRRVWSFWRQSDGNIETNMQNAFRGHLVVLADQATYSDGETFTAAIKALKLGPVIGKRTAGAGVFLTDRNSLVDFGMVRAAELPQFATDGRWIIEGHGVEPDIEVDNLPYASFNGDDAQLKRAIEYLQQQLKTQPVAPLKGQPLPKDATPAQDI